MDAFSKISPAIDARLRYTGADVVATLPGEMKPFAGKTDAEGRLALPKLVGLGAVAIRAARRIRAPRSARSARRGGS